MATFSVIKRSALEGSLRIDAQYYQEKYISNRNRISRFKCVRLGDISSVFRKGIFDIKASSYTDDGLPFVRIINLKDGLIDDSELVHIPVDIHLKESKTALTKGDVILSKTAYPAASLVTLDICNTSQDTIAIKLSDFWRNKLYSGYLVAFLNSFYGLLLLEQWFQGNIQMHLALPDAKRVLIPIFKEEYQQIIDNMWWEASKKRELAKLLYCQAEQLLLSEFGLLDWKPRHTLTYVRSFSQVKQANRMDAEHFQPKYEELREIIRNYSGGYLKLIDIAVNSNETIEPRANPEHDFEYIELADINQTIGVIENAKIIKGKDAPSRARMLLRSGDIIASSVEGSLDKVALVSEEYDGAIGSTGFFVLRPRTVSSGYLLALIKSIIVREQKHCESSGTILAAVPAKSLKNIIVPNIQQEIQDAISALVQQSHAARRESKTLLEKAKRAVEIAIEEGEERAMEYLNR